MPDGSGKLVEVLTGALIYEGTWEQGLIKGVGTFYKDAMRLQG